MSNSLYCVKCGDITEIASLHDVDGMTFKQALQAFRNNGCAGIGYSCSNICGDDRAMISELMFDLLGDDVDGIAAMMEDAEMLGYF